MKTTVLTKELLRTWRNLIAELYKGNLSTLQSNDGNRLIEIMRKTHNKIALAALTMDREILSITGRQGAGKTAFLKRYYSLDNTFLPENQSRGEDIPIIVYESNDVTEPVGKVLRVEYNENYGVITKYVEVSGEEFKNIAMKHKDQDVWLELVVPNRHFPDGSLSIALLPGFENDQRLPSQELITHMLRLSMSSIVVVRKDLYARQSNEKVFRVVQDIFTEVSPIFVLSHSDVNPEHNEEIKQRLVEDFKIGTNEIDRVLFTESDRNDTDWIEKVTDAIRKYGFLSEISEHRRREMLEEMVNEITDEINELERLLNDEEKKLKKQRDKMDDARIIFNFGLICERTLTNLEGEIKKSLGTKVEDAKQGFDNWVIENKGFVDYLRGKFSARALRERRQLQDAITEAWVETGKHKSEEIIANTVAEYIDRQSKILGNPLLLSDAPPPNSLVVPNDDQLNKKYALESKVVERIKQYFHPPTTAGYDKKILTLTDKELKTMMLLGVVICRQSLIARPLLEQIKDVNHSTPTAQINKPILEKTVIDMEKFASNLKKMEGVSISVLKSIPIILGVDALIDGENDLLNHASQALAAVGLPVLPPHLMAILGAVFALTYGVNAARAAVDDVNRRQLEFRYAGGQVIEGLPELQAQAFVNALRSIFDKMSEQLQEVHSRKKGDYDNTDALEIVQYQIRGIKNLHGKLRSMVINHATPFI